MNRLLLFLSALLLLTSSACGSNAGDPANVEFAPSLGVDLNAMNRSESGLYTQDLKVGTGPEALNGRYLEVHYTGWLSDGTQFDTSRDTNEPLPLVLGQTRVIEGWQEGLVGMRVGGQRRLVIPSWLGYGANGRYDAIPPNAVLVFDVELLLVR